MGTPVAKSKSKTVAPRTALRPKLQQALTSELSGAGAVKSCVQGSAASSTAGKFTPAKLVEVLQVGLPFRELQVLQSSLALPSEKLAPMLGTSKAAFHRSKGAASRLNSAVSDRVVKYAKPLAFAVKVFGNQEDAKQWLKAPQFGLGGAVPLDYAKTEIGAREVEKLLGRTQYGVYS